MSTKKATERPKTALIVPRESFKSELEERISIGREIEKRLKETSTIKQLEEAEKWYGSWSDYNVEFLKSKFNNTMNEYRSQYENAGMMAGMKRWTVGAN